jgi:hypothetical protein
LLGEGGFAVVFAVQDRKLSRRIAVKVLRPELTASRSTIQRFVREAEAAASLSHPHILTIFFVGEGEGLVYFGMPLVEGETLESLLGREGRLKEGDVVKMGAEIADALAEAHASGLVHRDVKPANVLLQGTRRRVLVADFGIAKAAAGRGDKLTGTGVVIGSPHYMSPEQASGSGEVDQRSDIYSLGVLIWQMLTGRVPFDGPDSQTVLVQHLTKPLPSLRAARTDVSPWLAEVVERCCAKKPDDRIQTAAELAEAFRCCNVPAPRPKPSARRYYAAAGAAVALAGAGLAAALVLSGGPRAATSQPARDSVRSMAPMVAVLPFELNLAGDTAQLARQAARSLANRMEARFGVGAVDINRLLGRWGSERRSLAAPLDSSAAFAYSLGANQLIIGNAFEAGRQLRVGVDVYDARTYLKLGHYELDGNQDALIPLLDQLAESVAVAFCKQPDFNPRNLCFDLAGEPSRPLSVAATGPLGGSAPSFYVLLGADGSFLDMRIREMPTDPDVAEAARRVISSATYRPARRAGVPVEAWTSVTVELRRDSLAVAQALGCDVAEFSLRNRDKGCWDSRPVLRTAPLVAVPRTCPAVRVAVARVNVASGGSVIGEPRITSSSGCPAFDSAAVAFLLDMSFAPALKDGSPVTAWTEVPLRGVPADRVSQ